MSSALPKETTIRVQFGPLTPFPQTFVDLHTLRAVGTERSRVDDAGVVVEFWRRHR